MIAAYIAYEPFDHRQTREYILGNGRQNQKLQSIGRRQVIAGNL